MWTKGVLLLLVLASLVDARVNSKNFHRLFDSSEEEYHNTRVEEETNYDQASANDGYRVRTVCHNEDKDEVYLIEGDGCDNKIAVGKYKNAVNETGWGILEVETFPEYSEEVQAYAAGVVEGDLTKLQIYYHFRNTVEGACNKKTRDYCTRLYKYLKANLDWIKSQVLSKPRTDLYWRMVNLTHTQVTGIYHGYMNDKNLTPSVEFELNPILMIQLAGDLIDLEKVLKKPTQLNDDPEPSHCSGFLKVTPGNRDLLFSHVSMSGYNTMNRIVKLYKFAYNKNDVPGNTYSFSSYAGMVVSSDDYTLINSGLASIETTIAIFNETLYTDKFVKPVGQLLCWLRSAISNQLAKTAKDWVDIFARYNSGTYNNQWTVVDYNKFTPGGELPNKDLVWILEQTPGYTESRDVTWFLRKYTYWPSYNIPYQTRVSQISGFDVKGNVNNWWRWGYAPRALIFHRDHNKVTDINSLYKLMRYNNYQKDEFSRCTCTPPFTAEAGISARGDLNPSNGSYEIPGMGHRNHGSLDYKGTSYQLFKQLKIHLVGGPTYDPLPPFNWATTDIVANHYGQPVLWKFQPFTTEWETKVSVDLKPQTLRSMSEEDDDSYSMESESEETF